MRICQCVYMCECAYVCVHVCVCVYVSMCVFVCVYTRTQGASVCKGGTEEEGGYNKTLLTTQQKCS